MSFHLPFTVRFPVKTDCRQPFTQHCFHIYIPGCEFPALPRLLPAKWLDRKLHCNWSADFCTIHLCIQKEKPRKGTNAYHPTSNHISKARCSLSAVHLWFVLLRYWHTIEPCSLLIGAQCLRWGERSIVMCCASVKGIGLTTTLAISKGSEGQASHDYMVMGLSQTS